jgi:Zn-dependent protease with chaperone function
MVIVALAWTFVVVMVALVELTSPRGSVMGALATLVFWGALPLGIVLYVMGASSRRRRLRAAAAAAASAADPDGSGQAPAAAAVTPEREEA